MGCSASKLDNEDTVRRCKERRRLMKEAVYSRHHLATAHSDYCHSLRITGSALVTFASGEPFSVSDRTPAVLLRTPSSTIAESKIPTFTPRTHSHNIPSPSPSVHPPPPPPPMSTTSSHFSHKTQPPPLRRRRKPVKLPHILSDSSFTSSPPPKPPNHNFTYNARADSTYSTTPSQTSSVWDWENFYPPPSPPDSEFFEQIHKGKKNEINNDNSDDDHRYIDNVMMIKLQTTRPILKLAVKIIIIKIRPTKMRPSGSMMIEHLITHHIRRSQIIPKRKIT